jgi:hypothetical protein
MIAASAVAAELPLYTVNPEDFHGIDDLDLRGRPWSVTGTQLPLQLLRRPWSGSPCLCREQAPWSGGWRSGNDCAVTVVQNVNAQSFGRKQAPSGPDRDLRTGAGSLERARSLLLDVVRALYCRLPHVVSDLRHFLDIADDAPGRCQPSTSAASFGLVSPVDHRGLRVRVHARSALEKSMMNSTGRKGPQPREESAGLSFTNSMSATATSACDGRPVVGRHLGLHPYRRLLCRLGGGKCDPIWAVGYLSHPNGSGLTASADHDGAQCDRRLGQQHVHRQADRQLQQALAGRPDRGPPVRAWSRKQTRFRWPGLKSPAMTVEPAVGDRDDNEQYPGQCNEPQG